MQLLICPGYHSTDLTNSFVRCLQRQISPHHIWLWPSGQMWDVNSSCFLYKRERKPEQNTLLQIIAFSAGVVVAYPIAMFWQRLGGQVRLLALDGWGMPLIGNLEIYRMSHDLWTHRTTYLPAPTESNGFFYATPTVEHLSLWQSPHATIGMGAINGSEQAMTALDFITAVLNS